MSYGVVNITGQRFGRLRVLEEVKQRPKGCAWWLCRCDCGELRQVRSTSLKTGATKSCGCLRREHAASLYARKHPRTELRA
jgi:hypothetical protein